MYAPCFQEPGHFDEDYQSAGMDTEDFDEGFETTNNHPKAHAEMETEEFDQYLEGNGDVSASREKFDDVSAFFLSCQDDVTKVFVEKSPVPKRVFLGAVNFWSKL